MSNTKTIFRAIVVIFGLHLLLKSLNSQKESRILMSQVQSFTPPMNPNDLSLASGTQEELIRRELEAELDTSSDQLLLDSLLQAGNSNGNALLDSNGDYNNGPNGSPRFGDNGSVSGNGNGNVSGNVSRNGNGNGNGSGVIASNGGQLDGNTSNFTTGGYNAGNCGAVNKHLNAHADSDYRLDQIVSMQNKRNDYQIGASNNCPTNFAGAQFGSSSVTPFSRSHGYGNGADEFNKNILGKFFGGNIYNPKTKESDIGSQFEFNQGLATFRGKTSNNTQIDNKNYQMSPYGNKAGSQCNTGVQTSSTGYSAYDSFDSNAGAALV